MKTAWTWLAAGSMALWSSAAAAAPPERPLAIAIDNPRPPPRVKAVPRVRDSGVIVLRNPGSRSLLVQLDEQSFWLSGWETTRVRVEAGSIDLDTRVRRRGALYPVESRGVWVEPDASVRVDLRRPATVYGPRWGVVVHTGGWGWRHSGHNGHHGRHHRSGHHW